MSTPPPTVTDDLLQPFLTSRNDPVEAESLDKLLRECAAPVVSAIIESRLRVSLRVDLKAYQTQVEQDAEDLYSRVMGELAARLLLAKQNPNDEPIKDLRAYAAVTTYRIFGRHLADRYRPRADLRERLRYLASHRPDLALWKDQMGRLVCGRTGMRGRDAAIDSKSRVGTLRADPRSCLSEVLPPAEVEDAHLPALVPALLEWLGQPIMLETLVSVVATLRGTGPTPLPLSASTDETAAVIDQIPDRDPSTEARVEQRDYVRRLWSEIGQLPKSEAAALLLDMARADGLAVILQLPLQGAATIDD